MSDKITWRRFWIFAGLSIGCLFYSSCATLITPEKWLCVDENETPLRDVVAFYFYSGTGWGPSYIKSGACITSDDQGLLKFPHDIVSHKPITDSKASRGLGFLYSPTTHVAYRNGAMNRSLQSRLILDDTQKKYTFIDASNNPDQWYISLRELLHISESVINERDKQSLAHQELVNRLQGPAASEKMKFVAKYGNSHPSYKLLDAIEYSKKHHRLISEITFSMLLTQPMHDE